MVSADQLSVTFAALADPTRRAILARLARGEASVTELAKPFDLSLPGVSKHLKVLQRAGLITQSRNAQWRPCRLESARLKEASRCRHSVRRLGLPPRGGVRRRVREGDDARARARGFDAAADAAARSVARGQVLGPRVRRSIARF